jgi:peptide/nickel transport system substrate-binding protein
MFITNWVGADVFNPIVNNMVGGQGSQGGWFGWADDPELEAMRLEFARAGSVEEQAAIAEQIQLRVYEQGYYAPIGQYFVPTAWSNNIEGILDGPAPFFWNIRRTD